MMKSFNKKKSTTTVRKKAKEQKKEAILLTGTHSHLMQYMTPNGGPKSAYHVEPNSRSVFPNWHSEMKTKKKVFVSMVV